MNGGGGGDAFSAAAGLDVRGGFGTSGLAGADTAVLGGDAGRVAGAGLV
jgi:hypothetical protein